MLAPAHHHLIASEIGDLRPTQITVGMAEVGAKRAEWAALGKKRRRAVIESHWFPAVLGPGQRHYIVDHHHLGLALREEGVDSVRLMLLEDLSYLEQATFWRIMEHRNWAHPFDAAGRRRAAEDIPRRIDRLVDDPYRSLAGFVRGAGGYAKDTAPFAEFLWADYFRPRIVRELIVDAPDDAVREGVALARSPLARYLPGWAGELPQS